ncbi:MAG: Bax inhibitor-1/YccA family protein [Spirochaetales bacterium]|nr:Bax inhibitor-1/YccA family protein [Leptospiraceae bacterium]MCP5482659.1 Bax inhibitor-1/YccA family protein [Spirochaetales bacterium]MCP5485041.1 Bax inhibitor-1/YccA family protein [Spirochaetales bacterium]
MRTANPALNDNTFRKLDSATGEVMTLQGTVNRSFILLLLLLAPACYVWNGFFEDTLPVPVSLIMTGGAILGLVVAIVTIFKKTWAPVTAPIYAIVEGALLGGLSAYFESMFPNIVIQAVALTFGTMGALLLAYTSRLIKVTQNFRLGIVAATGGIMLVYLVSFIGGFFGFQIPYIHGSGWIGIGFSLFVVVIAALNLVLDFDFIERGAEQGAPKYMEWYAAFGLLVTLIWLYIEILRLLAKIRSR